MRRHGRVLIIAGSDSGGGAGIQADIKTVTCMGGYAMTAITALTAQNTRGVESVHSVPTAFLQDQIRVVLEDIGADCIKTGMLHDGDTVRAVVDALDRWGSGIPLVVDPVMIAQSGDRLLSTHALESLTSALLPRATLLTPNLPEAEAFLGRSIDSAEAMPEAALALRDMTGGAVLLKGGHLPGDDLMDVLCTGNASDQLHMFRHRRIPTHHTHGSGCTLASAISAALAGGEPLEKAVALGRRYLLEAIRSAPGLGHGSGPVDHTWTVDVARLRC